jgi:hypothetical protein
MEDEDLDYYGRDFEDRVHLHSKYKQRRRRGSPARKRLRSSWDRRSSGSSTSATTTTLDAESACAGVLRDMSWCTAGPGTQHIDWEADSRHADIVKLECNWYCLLQSLGGNSTTTTTSSSSSTSTSEPFPQPQGGGDGAEVDIQPDPEPLDAATREVDREATERVLMENEDLDYDGRDLEDRVHLHRLREGSMRRRRASPARKRMRS